MTNYEDNPFEDKQVAEQWITSIEGERGKIRDSELYPYLKSWSEDKNGVLIDIGAGQGICAPYVQHEKIKYIGIDPSEVLVAHAKEKYANENRTFMVGNAYDLPLEDAIANVVLSVNVWFHLEDLNTAAKELARVLKKGGQFLISTANPNSYSFWETMFDDDALVTDKKIDGKVNIPVQALSRNVMYKHTTDEMYASLERYGLKVSKEDHFGGKGRLCKYGMFVNYEGRKE